MSQALALLEGTEFVTPELIQRVAVEVIAHRLVLEPEARFSGADARRIVLDIVARTAVPV
jgi:MoxR-like ATPase